MRSNSHSTRTRRPRLGYIQATLTGALALLLSPFVSQAERAPNVTEDAAWQRTAALQSPDAMQDFISHFPNSSRVADAFEMLVAAELAAADLTDSPDELTIAQTEQPESDPY